MSNTSTPSVWGSASTQYFFSLTPDAILNAVESAGYVCTGRTQALNSFENRVYEIEIETDASGALSTKKVVKFYRPGRWSKEQILEEHAFLLDLKHHEIPVVAPEFFEDGGTLKTLEQGIHFCVFPKVGGRLLDEPLAEDYEQLGRLIARIHQVGSAQPAKQRITLNEQSFGLQHLNYLTQEWSLFPKEHTQRYSDVIQSICSYAAPLFEQHPKIRLHGDCHFGNILKNQEQLAFVDFDDFVNGPEIQDLWLLARITDNKPFAHESFNLLIDGYEQIRPFDPMQAKLAAPLRGLRTIHFCAWIARRWDDPSFPKAFPEFNSSKYWQEHLNDLEDIAQNLGSVDQGLELTF